ncbi:MAG: DUF4404 family protein [Candidatus Omnitrophica bacterium]|nr:DUF4404 family protein [Candidatus Omnitrophota bacterium]
MKQEKLKQSLAKLTDEVAKIDTNDIESRKKLMELAELVRKKLETPDDQEQHNRFLEKLNDDIVHFKVDHPLVTATLEDMIAILNDFGV